MIMYIWNIIYNALNDRGYAGWAKGSSYFSRVSGSAGLEAPGEEPSAVEGIGADVGEDGDRLTPGEPAAAPQDRRQAGREGGG